MEPPNEGQAFSQLGCFYQGKDSLLLWQMSFRILFAVRTGNVPDAPGTVCASRCGGSTAFRAKISRAAPPAFGRPAAGELDAR